MLLTKRIRIYNILLANKSPLHDNYHNTPCLKYANIAVLKTCSYEYVS
jgi:hypothetical protein